MKHIADDPSLESIAEAIAQFLSAAIDRLAEIAQHIWTMPLSRLVDLILGFALPATAALVIIVIIGLLAGSVRWGWDRLGDNKAYRLGRWLGSKSRRN